MHLSGLPLGANGEIEKGLATQRTPRFLGTVPWFLEYKVLDEAALAVDLERITRQLRRRGYYEAQVKAARILRLDPQKVRVEIEVEAGPRVHVDRLETPGLNQASFRAVRAVIRSLALRSGDPFQEDAFERSKLAIVDALGNYGYAHARVKGKAEIDLATHLAKVVFYVDPGVEAVLGTITIDGCEKVPVEKVRSALQLAKGERFSRRELQVARSAVFRLGAFSKVEIRPDLSNPQSKEIPLKVEVDESALRSISAGGGLVFDVLRLGVNGQVGWTHRNFFGGLRKFNITLRPGLTFFPTRFNNLVAPTRILPENSLTTRLEQPGFLEGRTKGFLDAAYNVYPLIYPSEEKDPREETVIGYNEVGLDAGLERFFFGRTLKAAIALNWRMNLPFAYQGEVVEGLERVIVTYPELKTQLDFRDDPLSPKRGLLISNSLQVATPILGAEMTDIRIQPELRTFLPLDTHQRLIFATRATVGFVFPFNYGEALTGTDGTIDYSSPAVIEDQHKLLFRAFYSGGPNSNRGYP
ncbi:MAG: BamA/TamA family outer membrane protein, partial [Polyangiaceae bacterium]|nr:BamA/TamA family outer membrane protein [Polyangiaceae bacterium]